MIKLLTLHAHQSSSLILAKQGEEPAKEENPGNAAARRKRADPANQPPSPSGTGSDDPSKMEGDQPKPDGQGKSTEKPVPVVTKKTELAVSEATAQGDVCVPHFLG